MPFTSPTWNFPAFYSFEVDFAEREEWYSKTPRQSYLPDSSQRSRQFTPRIMRKSRRYLSGGNRLDPKYIGALTLRGSYTEAFHAPTLSELTPASSQNFPIVTDPFLHSDRATDRGANPG